MDVMDLSARCTRISDIKVNFPEMLHKALTERINEEREGDRPGYINASSVTAAYSRAIP